jgi:uncharacterized protein (TIGR03435 family)
MSTLAFELEYILNRPVIDETKLEGGFDFRIKLDRKLGNEGMIQDVRQQLGLALTPAKRKIEVVVVDARAAVRPSTNPSY